MMVSFARESFAAGVTEGRLLAARDYEETIPYKDACPNEIDEERYAALENAGLLRAFSARRDGRLIGYCIYVVTPGALHARNTKRATCTDWYLLPEERRGLIGMKLMKFAEAALRREGVVLMATSVMETSTAAQVLLARMGHTLTERIYTKVLNDA